MADKSRFRTERDQKIFVYDDKEKHETKLKVKEKSQVQEIWWIFWLNILENDFHGSIRTLWKEK